MKNRYVRGTVKVVSVLIVICIVIGFLQQLLVPKYVTDIQEGSMIEEYYSSEKNHDVIILGDCEVYENLSPVTMWNAKGITSYIRGSAEQLIWQSYYLLEDTLKYETPKVVVLNVLAMQESEAKSEAYNRMTLDGMKWSMSKVNSIKESMTEKETFASYVLPILRYHSRWSELSSEDINYMFKKDKVTSNGYLCQVGVRPVTTVPRATTLPDYQFSSRNYEYLDKIAALCRENNIELVLMKAPSVYPYWHEEWDKQVRDFADKNDITYINCIDKVEDIGIDYSTDTFDYGQHLNVEGAEKLSAYMAELISSKFKLADHRADAEYSDVWNQKAAEYEQMKQEKYKELGE